MLPCVLDQLFLGTQINSKALIKSVRGFAHKATGHLLCPHVWRDEFNEDPEKYSLYIIFMHILMFLLRFCQAVQFGSIAIKATDYSLFFYPEHGFNPEDIKQGLMHGPLLVKVSCQHFIN
jgi:hypothetical protein